MPTAVQSKRRIEFGDFQTPLPLARRVCEVVREEMSDPASVVEPTCGRGSFLLAALEAFPSLKAAWGFDVNSEHLDAARSLLSRERNHDHWEVRQQDFFAAEWSAILADVPDPLLVIGNPPWVTNAAVGSLAGSNLPVKRNQHYKGLDALTGKSNFDISEWMLIRLLDELQGRCAVLAMLCKTTVARKTLQHAWKHDLISKAEIRPIDAAQEFSASVDACLLICRLPGPPAHPEAKVFADLTDQRPTGRIGICDDRIVSDLDAYERTRRLAGNGPFRWRSGIKHDCAKVMELERTGRRFRNGLGELVDLEDAYLYPLLKSSDVARGGLSRSDRWMLVTQRSTGDDTREIARHAPRTWEYLQRHAERLDRRASSIYRGRPRFAIFGVGPYSFAPCKVAISCLYKRLSFCRIDSTQERPIVLDDTCAFLSFDTADQADFASRLLGSEPAQEFYRSRIFWDAKRPVTVDVLRQLDLAKLARAIAPTNEFCDVWERLTAARGNAQMKLF
mgnify:CR=1 FL=1